MKKKVENTSTKDFGYTMGRNPNAILEQEAKGQQEFTESLQLPRICNHPRGINATEQYHKMGIQTLTTSKGDNLFIGVKLPKGWLKKATDHSMWNELIDDKGRVRATIFYKASYYDRDAFINFEYRYISTHEFVEKKEGDKFHPKFYCVKDNSTKEILFKTEISHDYHDEALQKLCTDFLQTNFPDYKNLNAYWDEPKTCNHIIHEPDAAKGDYHCGKCGEPMDIVK